MRLDNLEQFISEHLEIYSVTHTHPDSFLMEKASKEAIFTQMLPCHSLCMLCRDPPDPPILSRETSLLLLPFQVLHDLGVRVQGTEHDALDDARNLRRMLISMAEAKGFDRTNPADMFGMVEEAVDKDYY